MIWSYQKLNQNYSSDNVFIELKKISKEEQDLKLELLKIVLSIPSSLAFSYIGIKK